MSLSSNFETREELCAQQRAGEAEEVKYVLWEIFDAVEKSKGRILIIPSLSRALFRRLHFNFG